MMRSALVCWFVVSVAGTSCPILKADESIAGDGVTVQTLAGNVPVLSEDNAAIDSFYLIAEVITPWDKRPMLVEYSWTRPEAYSYLLVDKRSRTPLIYMTGDQILMYDASIGCIMLDHGYEGRPNFRVASREDSIKMSFGITAQDPKTILDLASLIENANSAGRAKRTADGQWQLWVPSETGKTEVVATFSNEPDPQLKTFDVRAPGEASVVSVFQIQVNRPVPESLRAFPAEGQIPEELKILRLDELFGRGLINDAGKLHTLSRPVLAPAAIDNAKYRAADVFGKEVDWTAAAAKNAQFVLRLWKLIPHSKELWSEIDEPVK